ncbi:hypothetical protein M569_05680 [Genlisea aurea]|uniref:Uncharacterized protein n=1 Tax=Genlisea aurea TaxID=192259 RepID=S8CVV1_9LAMI|nr:hypothetical protein M569_05680 [Genlisea aurea]
MAEAVKYHAALPMCFPRSFPATAPFLSSPAPVVEPPLDLSSTCMSLSVISSPEALDSAV